MSVLPAFRSRRLRLPGAGGSGRPMVEAMGICVSFDGVPVLIDVDVTVRTGELVAIVGPNGAGKSTLLSVVAGDLVPDSGFVLVDGSPIGDWTADELAVRRGVLLQRVDVSFPFRVVEIVRMGRAPWGGTRREDDDDAVVAAAMTDTDVSRFAERPHTTLSGGERSRTALARVLAQRPVALLLDEPTSSLDIHHQEETLALARHRAAGGDAVAVVLHDLALAAAYAHRVVVLSGGAVAAAGVPEEVFDPELLTAVYDHPIEVLRHPRTGALLVVPRRGDP